MTPSAQAAKIPHSYQARAVEEILSMLSGKRKGGNALAPTGAGKSLIIALVAKAALEGGRPLIVVQPNEHLLSQNLAEIHAVVGDMILDGGRPVSTTVLTDQSKSGIGEFETGSALRHGCGGDIVMATQSSFSQCQRNRPADWSALLDAARRRAVVLIDEGEAAGAERFSIALHALAGFEGTQGVALTATPFRTDGGDPMLPFASADDPQDGGIIAEIGFQEVLDEGRVVPPVFVDASESFEAKLGDLRRTLHAAWDASGGDEATAEAAADSAVSALLKAPGGPRAYGRAVADILDEQAGGGADAGGRGLCLVHTPSIESAEAAAAEIGRKGMRGIGRGRSGKPRVVAVVSSKGCFVVEDGIRRPAEADAVLRNAREGKIDVLVNCEALGRGTNVPGIDLQIFAHLHRGHRSALQNIGRGLRADAASGKKDCRIVDLGRTVSSLADDVLGESPPGHGMSGPRAVWDSMPPAARRQFIDMFAAEGRFLEARRETWLRSRGAETPAQRRVLRRAAGDEAKAASFNSVALAVGTSAFARPSSKDGPARIAVFIDAVSAGLVHPAAGGIHVAAAAGPDRRTSTLRGFVLHNRALAKETAEAFVPPAPKPKTPAKRDWDEEKRFAAELAAGGFLRPSSSSSADARSCWRAAGPAVRAAVCGAFAAAAFGERFRSEFAEGRISEDKIRLADPAKMTDAQIALVLAWAHALPGKPSADGRGAPIQIVLDGEGAGTSKARILSLLPPAWSKPPPAFFRAKAKDAIGKTGEDQEAEAATA